VNEQYGIEINGNDLLPENFNTAAALYELIQKLKA
jgi:acyl carrier protein